MFEFGQLQALKELVGGEELEQELIDNPNKGSSLNPGSIGGKSKEELAKPFSKVEAKFGKRYEQK